MILRYLSLRQFRNYPELHQEFAPGLNLIVGANGQGKTNLLEAIYLLATSKSLRGSRDVDLIGWDAPAALVTGEVLREKSHDVELEVVLSRQERKALVVNTVRVSRAMEFVGQLKAVAFSATDVEIVRGEPSRRRRFLDLGISQISPSYCHALACYRKVVEQRTRLLKALQGGRGAGETLEAWTEQLVTYGERLVERRRQFVEQLEERARVIHERLTEGRERLTVAYEPSFRLRAGETAEAAYRRALGEQQLEELRRGVCLVGPHRDEVLFLIDGRDARVFGSQGQQRTVALSVRLGELELMRELTGETPVCLLDDVFSELDARRRKHLFEVTLEQCQTFLTTTDLGLLPEAVRDGAQLFWVEEGRLEPEGRYGMVEGRRGR